MFETLGAWAFAINPAKSCYRGSSTPRSLQPMCGLSLRLRGNSGGERTRGRGRGQQEGDTGRGEPATRSPSQAPEIAADAGEGRRHQPTNVLRKIGGPLGLTGHLLLGLPHDKPEGEVLRSRAGPGSKQTALLLATAAGGTIET